MMDTVAMEKEINDWLGLITSLKNPHEVRSIFYFLSFYFLFYYIILMLKIIKFFCSFDIYIIKMFYSKYFILRFTSIYHPYK